MPKIFIGEGIFLNFEQDIISEVFLALSVASRHTNILCAEKIGLKSKEQSFQSRIKNRKIFCLGRLGQQSKLLEDIV